MVCEAFSAIEGFADFLVWPTGCDYYFYLKIFIGIFIILTWGLYKAEKKMRTEADFISCLGVSSLAILILGLIGTLIKNSAGIAMIQAEVLLYILAFSIPLLVIWIFKE